MSTVLQFSGGKDSLACLYLLRPQWQEFTVAWTNPGAAFPETLELMARVRELVPHFVEIRASQNISTRGWPADIVPTLETFIGRISRGLRLEDGPLFQSRFDCCAASIWGPMDRAMREMGAKVIIRGQRNSDRLRAPLLDGQVVDGIEYRFPIASWTDAQVSEFLCGQQLAPPGGDLKHTSSLDCWNCTAYLDENLEKLAFLKARHPARYAQVHEVLVALDQSISAARPHLSAAIAGDIR